MPSFKEKVLKIVSQIPEGKVLSYGEVAWRAGGPGSARAVGNIMKQNRNPRVPCHRVIHSDGRIGGFNRGREFKAELLKKEGLKISFKLKVVK